MNTEDGLLNLPVQNYRSRRNDSGVWVKAFFAGRPPALILVDPDVSFIDFKQSIQDALLNATEHSEGVELVLAYLDADGDRLQLCNQEQLEAAIALYEKLKRSFVHVFCQPKTELTDPLISPITDIDNTTLSPITVEFVDSPIVQEAFTKTQNEESIEEKLHRASISAIATSIYDDETDIIVSQPAEPLTSLITDIDNTATISATATSIYNEETGIIVSQPAEPLTSLITDIDNIATSSAIATSIYDDETEIIVSHQAEPLISPITDIDNTARSLFVVELIDSPIVQETITETQNEEPIEEKLHRATIFAMVTSIYDDYLDEDESEIIVSLPHSAKLSRLRPANRFKSEKVAPFIVPIIKRNEEKPQTSSILNVSSNSSPRQSNMLLQNLKQSPPIVVSEVSEKKPTPTFRSQVKQDTDLTTLKSNTFMTAVEAKSRFVPQQRFGSDPFLDLPKTAPLPDRKSELRPDRQFKLGPVLAKPTNKSNSSNKALNNPVLQNNNITQMLQAAVVPQPKLQLAKVPDKPKIVEPAKPKKLFKKHVELRPKPAPKVAVKQSDRSLVPRITSNKPPTKHIKVIAKEKPKEDKSSQPSTIDKNFSVETNIQEAVFEHRRFLPPIPEDRTSSPSFTPIPAARIMHQRSNMGANILQQPMILMDPITGQLMYAPNPYLPYGFQTRPTPPLLLDRELNPNPRFEDLFGHDLDASDDDQTSVAVAVAHSPKVSKAKVTADKEASKPKYGWAVNGKYSRAR